MPVDQVPVCMTPKPASRRGFARAGRQSLPGQGATTAAMLWPALPEAAAPALQETPAPGPVVAKRAIDLFGAAFGLIFLSPLFLLIALLVKLTSPGPALFLQLRVGQGGRKFHCFKFRTMMLGAEHCKSGLADRNELSGPVFKMRCDPRVTWLGRILRKYSLDELPQLWNVLRGEMSLVGPRPPTSEEVAKYSAWQRRRLTVKPGMTGLWQVSGRSSIPDFTRWVELDLEYVDRWSLLLDLKILLKTLPAVVSARGAW